MIVTDRCPGVLAPHRAEDGLMIRLRIPGGRTEVETLTALSALAGRFGNPELQLTTRAGLQLRGLTDPVPDALVESLPQQGLLPSASHERVRNIACSPLTGLHGGRADLTALVAELDDAVLSRPRLAELSGRFLFALDDGRGDVTTTPFDLAFRARTASRGVLLVGGRDHGFDCSTAQAVPRLVELAESFLMVRPDAGVWHVRDLPGGPATLAPSIDPLPAGAAAVPLGPVGTAASVQVPLGLLTPRQVGAVAEVATGPVIITPWRGLVVPGGAAGLARLGRAGFVSEETSPWSMISACVGAPHCHRTTADTRSTALALVDAGQVGGRTHVSGCPRRCGAPAGAFTDLVLQPEPTR